MKLLEVSFQKAMLFEDFLNAIPPLRHFNGLCYNRLPRKLPECWARNKKKTDA